MIILSIILFAVAALLAVFGILIYRGNTKLINDQHQRNVPEDELKAYGRSFSKGLFVMAASFIISGIVGLIDSSSTGFSVSLIVLFAGIIISSVILIIVQKKYNGGMF